MQCICRIFFYFYWSPPQNILCICLLLIIHHLNWQHLWDSIYLYVCGTHMGNPLIVCMPLSFLHNFLWKTESWLFLQFNPGPPVDGSYCYSERLLVNLTLLKFRHYWGLMFKQLIERWCFFYQLTVELVSRGPRKHRKVPHGMFLCFRNISTFKTFQSRYKMFCGHFRNIKQFKMRFKKRNVFFSLFFNRFHVSVLFTISNLNSHFISSHLQRIKTHPFFISNFSNYRRILKKLILSSLIYTIYLVIGW